MRAGLVWVSLLALAGAAAQLTPSDTAPLRAPGNLLSNGSLEAGDPLPHSWTLTQRAEYVRLTPEPVAHGQRAWLVDSPGQTPPVDVIARQRVPGREKCSYRLTGWVNLLTDRGGQVGLRLTAQDRNQRRLQQQEVWLTDKQSGWRPITVEVLAPGGTCWLQVEAPLVRGGARVAYDALSLRGLAGAWWLPSGPSYQSLMTKRLLPNAALVMWDGLPGAHQIFHRPAPWPPLPWTAGPVLTDAHHTLLGLTPETSYEVRIRPLPEPYYDERGALAQAPWRLADSPVLSFRTPLWAPRPWNGLRVWPAAALNTFPADQSRPCVEVHREALLVAECYGGGIHLSRVAPDSLRVEWTREIIARPPEGEGTPTQLDTCLLHDTLYLTYGVSAGSAGRSPRQMLAAYDLVQGKPVGEPRSLPLLQSGASASSVCLTAFRDQVWVAWLEATSQEGRRHHRLLLAPVSTLGETAPAVWVEAPTTGLAYPALVAHDGQLMVVFTDTAEESRVGYEPLYAIRFDGQAFHGLQKLSALGRNRCPRGVSLGDRWALAYANDAAYPSYNGLYQDLLLAVMGGRGLSLNITPLADDMTYNAWPDMTLLDRTLYVVYEKYDQAYGNPLAPAHSYGTFMQRLDLGGE